MATPALALALAPTAAQAHDLEGLGAALAGGAAGLVAAALLARLLARRAWRRLLVLLLLGPVLVVLGGVVAVGLNRATVDRGNAAFQQEQDRFQRSPLPRVACSEPPEALKAFLDSAAGRAETPDVVGRTLDRCGLGPAAAELAVFRLLAPVLARAPHAADTPPSPYPVSYCLLLARVHGARRADQVRALQSEGLPLNCLLHGAPVWWRGLGSADGLAWLQALRDAPGIDFGQHQATSGETVLDLAVPCQDAPSLRLLMQAARVDPQRASGPRHERAPVVVWTLRRHGAGSDNCPLAAGPDADVAAVDALMGPITAAHINQAERGNGQTLLWRLPRDDAAAAALLAHLIAQGADLQARDDAGRSFVHALASGGPALLGVLAGLPDAELQRLAGPPKLAVPEARRRGQAALADFLCARGAAGC